MKNKIGDLRNHLFAVIEGLLDEENPLEVERALAVAAAAKQIIDSAKVEVMAAKHLDNALGTDFISAGNGAKVISGANLISRANPHQLVGGGQIRPNGGE